MRDGSQRFVISDISRAQIAMSLNSYMEDHANGSLFKPFSVDDDRLTDEICQGYAKDLAGVTEVGLDIGEDSMAEASDELDRTTLVSFGILESNDGES